MILLLHQQTIATHCGLMNTVVSVATPAPTDTSVSPVDQDSGRGTPTNNSRVPTRAESRDEDSSGYYRSLRNVYTM